MGEGLQGAYVRLRPVIQENAPRGSPYKLDRSTPPGTAWQIREKHRRE